MAFKISVSTDPNQTIVITGALDEVADLSTLKVQPRPDIHMDLAGLTAINSTGIRIFKNWVYTLPCKTILVYNCPKVFVDQLNMIAGFLPAHSKIESFFVPFFDEDTDEEMNVLMKRGEAYSVENGVPTYQLPKPAGNFI